MGTEERPAFGELLRRHRLAAGLTQEALADRTGLSVRGLSDLERGARRAPHSETVRRLVQALRLSDVEAATRQTVRGRQPAAGAVTVPPDARHVSGTVVKYATAGYHPSK
jgi:transcriptional regulator with XRE-family HTH domain